MELRCTKCGQTKPAEEMCKNKKRPSGYSSHCKACHRAYYTPRPKVYSLKPGDEKRCTKCNQTKSVEEFIKDDRYRLGYMSNCRECHRAMARAWKCRNKERVREYQKRWLAENPEYHKEWWSALPEEAREIQRERVRAYFRTPHGKIVAVNHQHQRRRATEQGDVTPEWIERLYETQASCAYCGREFSDELPPTIDHIIPLSKEGTHTKANIVLACQPCNSSKGNRIISISCTA